MSSSLNSDTRSELNSQMLRRNGKPKSCEPCRISKIKCDHATPTCEKCQTRGIADQCFYHPNPMTKPAGTPRKKPERRRRKEENRGPGLLPPPNQDRLASLTLSPPTLRNHVGPPSSIWPSPPDSGSQATTSKGEPARSFYLGSTSYASVFMEEGSLPDTVHEQPSERHQITPPASMLGTRHCQIGIAHSIIQTLSPFSFFEKSVHMSFEDFFGSALIGSVLIPCLPQLREDIRRLTAPGTDLPQEYAKITKNTAKPLKVPSTMLPSEFHTLMTGENLRWETLGLILAMAGCNAQYTAADDPFLTLDDGTKIKQAEFIENMIQASNDCVNLCQIHGAVNDVMVWFLYLDLCLISNFYGDNYHGAWRRLGDTITAVYAAGIHCEAGNTHAEPLFLRESRRRVYASIYWLDKAFAMFMGRPPMMAWRYSDRRQLLDISDETLGSDDLSLSVEAISKIGADGWNTEGKVYPASYLRLRCQHAVFKERILEQSLAGEKDTNIIENLQIISDELTQFWHSVPPHLRYDTYINDSMWGKFRIAITLRLIAAYLEYLYTHFQIQRMLYRQTQTALPALLEVSLRLLSVALVVTKPNHQSYEAFRSFPTVMIFTCFPAAGILALELRRCTKEGTSLPDTVSRAKVIRTLSVMTSCLDWISVPGDGNHKLCTELNKMLAAVLDEVLNYQPPVQKDPEGGGEATMVGVENSFFDMPLIEGLDDVPTESEDFLNWLDTATWSNNVNLF